MIRSTPQPLPAGGAPPWPRPRGLLLDAMGTLISLRDSVGTTYAAVAAEHGLRLDAQEIDRAFAVIYSQAPPLAFPGLDGPDLQQAERQWWADRIDALLNRLGEAPGTPRLHRDLFERFADPDLWMVPQDVPGALARWHRQGLRLAVVSNFDQRLINLLEALDLSQWFTAVVISSRAGAGKPSPEPLLQALELLELQPREAWHIGDSPEDAAAAQAAGVPCLLVRRP
ncbi:MAG: HAD-IA family hydrolase [Synechococcus sp. ELA057]